jgi:hypothetical protein
VRGSHERRRSIHRPFQGQDGDASARSPDVPEVVEHAVGVRDSVSFPDVIAPAGGVDEVRQRPKTKRSQRDLREPQPVRASPVVVRVRDEDRAASDTQHLGDHPTVPADVMEHAESRHDVERTVRVIECVRVSIDETLGIESERVAFVAERREGFDAFKAQGREASAHAREDSSRAGADVEEQLQAVVEQDRLQPGRCNVVLVIGRPFVVVPRRGAALERPLPFGLVHDAASTFVRLRMLRGRSAPARRSSRGCGGRGRSLGSRCSLARPRLAPRARAGRGRRPASVRSGRV